MEERIHPKMVVDYHLHRQGIAIEQLGVAETVVITWGKGVVLRLASAFEALENTEHWLYPDRTPLFTGRISGRRVTVVHSMIGAPATVTLMEELIACGASTFIGIGWAGGLQPENPVGSVLLPDSCISEEGTSRHYLPQGMDYAPDAALAEVLEASARQVGIAVKRGLQWSTDAPYRELKTTIDAYRQQGVLGVDMETSAMYALGMFRSVRVCNLLVVSDEVHGEWNPAFGKEPVVQGTLMACEAIIDALKKVKNPRDVTCSNTADN